MNLRIFVFLYALIGFSAFSLAENIPGKTIIRFDSTVNQVTALQLLADARLDVVKLIPDLNMYVVNAQRNSSKIQLLSTRKEVLYTEANTVIKAYTTPTDPSFSRQWHHQNLASELAWDLGTGSAAVVVAIVDTGISLQHQDLKNQIWINTKETANNFIDDDGNGYVDDVQGWDFFNNDNIPEDDNDHGSHCAGIVGAEANNGRGGVGVAWQVRLMPLKFLDRNGSGELAEAIQAIVYAANNGANVINASWGSTEESTSLRDAIEFAGQRNVLFVAAAGNDNANNDTYKSFPANYDLPNLLSVGASTSSNGVASFSSYGATRVHIAAPGEGIYSTVSGASGYDSFSGTSMAAPMVVGVAALILSKEPSMDFKALRNAVLNATLPAKSWEGRNATDGIIQANLAISQLANGPQIWPKNIRLMPGARHEMSAFGITNATWSTSAPNVLSISPTGVVLALANGTAEVTAIDLNGQPYSATVEVITKSSSGGGCSRDPNVPPGSSSPAESSLFLLLSLMSAFALRMRKRGKKS